MFTYSYSPSPPSSSYYTTTPAMEIPTSSSARTISPSPSCAYPSWPRRASLEGSSNNSTFELANSYISDEDLFPVFDDEADTESSSSANTTPSHSMSEHIVGVANVACTDFMRQLVAEEKARKHQEREAKRRARRSSSRKPRRSSTQKMSPILE